MTHPLHSPQIFKPNENLDHKVSEWLCSKYKEEPVHIRGWYTIQMDDFCDMPADVIDAIIQLARERYDLKENDDASVLREVIDGDTIWRLVINIRPTWLK